MKCFHLFPVMSKDWNPEKRQTAYYCTNSNRITLPLRFVMRKFRTRTTYLSPKAKCPSFLKIQTTHLRLNTGWSDLLRWTFVVLFGPIYEPTQTSAHWKRVVPSVSKGAPLSPIICQSSTAALFGRETFNIHDWGCSLTNPQSDTTNTQRDAVTICFSVSL